jgi:hypothetical protein
MLNQNVVCICSNNILESLVVFLLAQGHLSSLQSLCDYEVTRRVFLKFLSVYFIIMFILYDYI